jgi:hypothetical protein
MRKEDTPYLDRIELEDVELLSFEFRGALAPAAARGNSEHRPGAA